MILKTETGRKICLLWMLFINLFTGFAQQPTATITEEGAWCWFADPRAISYKNDSGTINATYIGYIDVHGNIKATQINHNTNSSQEVLIRSYFQPDDHNNPTFLVLPDERIMVFYSRHTDEACFYYRVSTHPGDITSLGKEFKLKTTNNTTYPSPFILSDDPEHIYLCWRGIGWHPTIARLTVPDANDEVSFNWGPYQMVKSLNGRGGVRPYAKYVSNGKDKIYMAYTANHPDNGSTNFIYFNYFDVNDKSLKNIKGNPLAKVSEKPFEVQMSQEYQNKYPLTVVDNSSNRNWLWELSLTKNEHPVIATVRINKDKSSHSYYHTSWTGNQWQQVFLTEAGGHFHQSPNIEKCYSGGMAIDKNNTDIMYVSKPIEGKYGKVYELVKYQVTKDGTIATEEQLTFDSEKGNSRPFMIKNNKNPLPLIWMYGDYFDWIVSKQRPKGYATGIKTFIEIPHKQSETKKKLVKKNKSLKAFTIVMELKMDDENYDGEILNSKDFSYGIAKNPSMKPYFKIKDEKYISSNVFGSSDVWKQKNRGTGGAWYTPSKFDKVQITITYDKEKLITYVNGLIDQVITVNRLTLKDLDFQNFKGKVVDYKVYKKAWAQQMIKK
ncbi:BNR repeat-containing protein [Wenyingzhuangia sp. IMCC45467]